MYETFPRKSALKRRTEERCVVTHRLFGPDRTARSNQESIHVCMYLREDMRLHLEKGCWVTCQYFSYHEESSIQCTGASKNVTHHRLNLTKINYFWLIYVAPIIIVLKKCLLRYFSSVPYIFSNAFLVVAFVPLQNIKISTVTPTFFFSFKRKTDNNVNLTRYFVFTILLLFEKRRHSIKIETFRCVHLYARFKY